MEEFVTKVPLFFPEGYHGFQTLPDDFNPYVIPEGEKPTTWMINITGLHLLAVQWQHHYDHYFDNLGDKPGIKSHDMYSVVVTSTCNEILFKYRELRRLRFNTEGNYALQSFINFQLFHPTLN